MLSQVESWVKRLGIESSYVNLHFMSKGGADWNLDCKVPDSLVSYIKNKLLRYPISKNLHIFGL